MNSTHTKKIFTDFLTVEDQLSQLPQSKMEQSTRKPSLVIVISELIKGYVHD